MHDVLGTHGPAKQNAGRTPKGTQDTKRDHEQNGATSRSQFFRDWNVPADLTERATELPAAPPPGRAGPRGLPGARVPGARRIPSPAGVPGVAPGRWFLRARLPRVTTVVSSLECHVNGTFQYVALGLWLLPLSKMHLGFLLVAPCDVPSRVHAVVEGHLHGSCF